MAVRFMDLGSTSSEGNAIGMYFFIDKRFVPIICKIHPKLYRIEVVSFLTFARSGEPSSRWFRPGTSQVEPFIYPS